MEAIIRDFQGLYESIYKIYRTSAVFKIFRLKTASAFVIMQLLIVAQTMLTVYATVKRNDATSTGTLRVRIDFGGGQWLMLVPQNQFDITKHVINCLPIRFGLRHRIVPNPYKENTAMSHAKCVTWMLWEFKVWDRSHKYHTRRQNLHMAVPNV